MASQKPSIKERDQELAHLGYMTEERMATLLAIKVVSLRNRHDLPPRYKLGRNCVYRTADVQAWMARRAVAA